MNYVTSGPAAFYESVSPDAEGYCSRLNRKGWAWLKNVGVTTRSDDLGLIAWLCVEGMSKLRSSGDIQDDFLVAGEVLDEYVTDHDAELLAQAVPEIAARVSGPVGGMTPEATAVHGVLLDVVGAVRERYEEEDLQD